MVSEGGGKVTDIGTVAVNKGFTLLEEKARREAIVSLAFDRGYTREGKEMMIEVGGLTMSFVAAADLIRQLTVAMRTCIPLLVQDFEKGIVRDQLTGIMAASTTLRNMFSAERGE